MEKNYPLLNFYLKTGEYNKGCFDQCKTFFLRPESKVTTVIFADATWNKESFLETFGDDPRLLYYIEKLKMQKKKAIRRAETKKIEEENYNRGKKIASNIMWLMELLFQEHKYRDLTDEEDQLFGKLDQLNDKIMSRYDKKETVPADADELYKKKANALTQKALGILELPEDDFVDFIYKKQTGYFAKQIMEAGIQQMKEEEENQGEE